MGPTVTTMLRTFLWVGLTAFGAARWTNLEAAFVRTGRLRQQDFFRDLAVSQTLPGPGFVNMTALCGMRLGGVPLALGAVALVLLPGLIVVVLALMFLSADAPHVAGFLRGVLVGAVGVLAASFVRVSRRVRRGFDALVAVAVLLLVIAGVPLVASVAAVGAAGVLFYRSSAQPLP